MVWFKSPSKILKNKESLKSLFYFLLKIQKNEVRVDQESKRIFSLVQNFNFQHRLNFEGELSNNEMDESFKLAVFNYEGDENEFPNVRKQKLCEYATIGQMTIKCTQYIDQTIVNLLEEENFTKRFDILVEFEEELAKVQKEYHARMDKERQILEEQGLFEEEKMVQRKVFAEDLNIKMMSQDEVRA